MKNKIDYRTVMNRVIAAVYRAAKEMKDSFKIKQKSTRSDIVTTSDIAVEKCLIAELKQILPEAGVLSEEAGKLNDSEYMWIVDPIDGTANYARGIYDCGISVGLVHDRVPVVGVVYSKRKHQLFAAARGYGATLNRKRIHVSDETFEKSILCTAMSLYKKEYAPVCFDIISDAYYKCNDIRRFGSAALELCYLAAGQCDLYFELRVFPWDYAGAAAILSEAGGVITGLNGAPLTFDRPTVIIAANTKANHKMLTDIVGKHLKTTPYPEEIYV